MCLVFLPCIWACERVLIYDDLQIRRTQPFPCSFVNDNFSIEKSDAFLNQFRKFSSIRDSWQAQRVVVPRRHRDIKKRSAEAGVSRINVILPPF